MVGSHSVPNALAGAAAVLLATGVAACGGGDAGPSKSAYVEKADAVCAEADAKLDDIFRATDKEESPTQAQRGLRAMIPVERKLLLDLRALEKPKDDQDEIDRIYAARARGVEDMEVAARSPASAAAFLESDPGGEATGQKGGYDEAARLASAYGMVDCEAASPGSVAG